MNKTISVNLGGSVFYVEEDAFNLLKTYLDRIKLNFNDSPDEEEIMADIEVRIAELFLQHLDERKNVVIRKDVEEMIAIMGQPEDYNVGSESSRRYDHSSVRNRSRRLFRDCDDARIGGVCAGIGHYLGWDPVVIRILFVVIGIASGGSVILDYIILWAIVPGAETTGEKLQMRGEPVNVDNIRRFVRDEARKAGENINKWSSNASTSAVNNGREIVSGIGKVVSKIIGIILLFIGIGMFIGLTALIFFSQISIFGQQVNIQTMNALIFNEDGSWWMITLGTLLVIGIPAIAMIYAAIRLLVGVTRRIRGFSWTMAALFFFGLSILFVGGLLFGKEWMRDASLKSELVLPASSDTLYVNVANDTVFTGRMPMCHHGFFDLVKIAPESVTYGEPVKLDFDIATDDSFSIRVERSSNGPNLESAGKYAESIIYNYELHGDTLDLSPFFTTPSADKYRGQEVEITIHVPVGKSVHFGEHIGFINWHDKFAGKVVTMKKSGWEEYDHE
ncbi:MAG: PspC domain-containing protein [Crocinitomicaceae bacterium]|nr:PspC domain-containing protein [Crocinitomicaceae bacterium]